MPNSEKTHLTQECSAIDGVTFFCQKMFLAIAFSGAFLSRPLEGTLLFIKGEGWGEMVDTQEWEKLWGKGEDRRMETGMEKEWRRMETGMEKDGEGWRRRRNEGQGAQG